MMVLLNPHIHLQFIQIVSKFLFKLEENVNILKLKLKEIFFVHIFNIGTMVRLLPTRSLPVIVCAATIAIFGI